eukprot:3579387-Ditylum_brightwellii.AAC.1
MALQSSGSGTCKIRLGNSSFMPKLAGTRQLTYHYGHMLCNWQLTLPTPSPTRPMVHPHMNNLQGLQSHQNCRTIMSLAAQHTP